MQNKHLDIEEPESCGEKHCDHQRKKFSGSRVIESSEDGAANRGKIAGDAKGRHGDPADFRISAAEHFETAGLSAASGGFAGKGDNGQVGRIGQTEEAE